MATWTTFATDDEACNSVNFQGELDANLSLHRTTSTSSRAGAGAVALTSAICEIATDSADALTLADGSEGQHLYLVMITDSGDGTLTPTNLAGGTTITFDDVGDTAHLLFTNAAWYMIGGTATLA